MQREPSTCVINVSNISKGGGAQIAIWFINKLLAETHPKIGLKFFVSPFVYQGLSEKISSTDRESDFFVVEKSPVRSATAKKQLSELVKLHKVDLVYTLYGPSGVDFDCPEISGVANAWITCATLKDFRLVHGLLAPLEKLKYIVHGLSLKKKDFLVFETETSRNNYCNRFNYPVEKTQVIPNTVNDHFYDAIKLRKVEHGVFKFLYVSAYYKHKNFEMLPAYIKSLKSTEVIKSFKFQLTLSDSEFGKLEPFYKQEGCLEYIENLGVLASEQLPEIYQQCDSVISPSVIETFSATYAEAILSQKHLIVADRDFSREICQDAALYFDPFDPESFRAAAERVYCEQDLENIVNAAVNKSLFIKPSLRYEKLCNLFNLFN